MRRRATVVDFVVNATASVSTRLTTLGAMRLDVLELNGNFLFVGSSESDSVTMLAPPSVVPANHSGVVDLRLGAGSDRLRLWCLPRAVNATGTMDVTLDAGDGADVLTLLTSLGGGNDVSRRVLLRGGQYVFDGPVATNQTTSGNDGLVPSWCVSTLAGCLLFLSVVDAIAGSFTRPTAATTRASTSCS